MSRLFSPLQIREIEFSNRIVMSPMCQYSSVDGFANDWHLVHLGSRAVGGAAAVIAEATGISPEGRISPGDLGIWKDDHIDGLRRITSFVLSRDCIPGIQLAHAGRKASHREPWNGDTLVLPSEGGWKTVAPSAVAFSPDYDMPVALTKEGIGKVVSDFGEAARRAREAGFRIIEVHAAHGYLINEFMSPLSNFRDDEYGGSFENRIRILREIVASIRANWPEKYPLFVRISSTDWTDGGWTIDDSVGLAKILKNEGVDLIDCSSGGIIPGVKIPAAPGYQVSFSEVIRKHAGIPTATVGIIVSPEQAEEILAGGRADLIVIGRQLLRDPYFPLHAAHELESEIRWPVQYLRAKRGKQG
jgi:2,4-dienoyl-CoA reductase-like NADH-dependent reductase (Old Yellow Enzyme family)